MCGIAGIISKHSVDPAHLIKMSETLRHRGPDDEGFYVSGNGEHFLKGKETISELNSLNDIRSLTQDNNFKLGLVHRRLSIIDLSPAGHQPMQNAKEDLVIIFNGEIYNYKEIRSELEKNKVVFKTGTDTEVILAAYAYWGKDCVNRFVGMWAFCIYDKGKEEIFLSRDRFGIKPLYYFFNANLFVFASEIKALLEIPEIEPIASVEQALEFISYGALSDPQKNLYKNIQQVQPAHNLAFNISAHSIVQHQYYDLEKGVNNYNSISGDPGNVFNELLSNSIDLHLRSDVEIGSALSGGLDSSTLVALAANKMPGTFKTFTASYSEKGIDETYFAKLVSSNFSNIKAFYAHPSSSGYWESVDKLIRHQDLPINSTSMFAQWEVMKTASQQNIRVLLDGQGADEILGGYYNFAGIHLLEYLKSFRFGKFKKERELLKQNFTPNINAAIGRAGFYFLPSILQKMARSNKRLAFDFISAEFKDQILKIKVPERGGRSFKEQSFLSIKYGMQDLLRYEDRNSMAFSIESRVPFLDHRLVEFCIALDNEEKIKGGWTKYILRKKAETILPKEIAWRKDKMGFLTPQQTWKNESKKNLTNFLNETPIPSFIDKKYLLELCNSDLTNSSHLSEFWKIISFLKWVEVFKVKFI